MSDEKAQEVCYGWGYNYFKSIGLNRMTKDDVLAACDLVLKNKLK